MVIVLFHFSVEASKTHALFQHDKVQKSNLGGVEEPKAVSNWSKLDFLLILITIKVLFPDFGWRVCQKF